MAYVSIQPPVAASFASRVKMALVNFSENRNANRLFRKTVSELRQLSDHELLDLGLTRATIYDVARASVYKN